MSDYDLSNAETFAKEFAGNWRKFESFSWHRRYDEEDIPDPDNWGISYTGGRDANLLAESNEEVIREELSPFLGGDALEECHNHWAVGYVTGFAVRVRDGKGKLTEAFLVLYDLAARVEAYPVLDEEDFNEREHVAEIAYIQDYGRPDGLEYVDILPDDWATQVWSELWDGGRYFVHEGNSVWLDDSEEVLRETLLELKFAYDEEEKEEEE